MLTSENRLSLKNTSFKRRGKDEATRLHPAMSFISNNSLPGRGRAHAIRDFGNEYNLMPFNQGGQTAELGWKIGEIRTRMGSASQFRTNQLSKDRR